jgi:ElaB/YqjD/DUF883 family membrane-anchored ribosome-binding protein
MPTTIPSDDRLQGHSAANDSAANIDTAAALEHAADSLHVPGRADEAIRRFGARLKDIDATVEQARVLAAKASDHVRERPLSAIGIAAGVGAGLGLLVGLLARQRR